MRLFLPALLVAALSAAQSKQTFTGIITDEGCPKGDHSGMRMGANDAECTKLCVMLHDSVYVLYDGKDSYELNDKKKSEAFAGQKVRVTGTLDTKTKRITVESIVPASSQDPPPNTR